MKRLVRLTILLLLPGCADSVPKPPETESSIADEQAQATLPEDFPADVPLPPDAEIRMVVSGMGQASVSLRCEQDEEAVNAYFRSALAAKGWEVETEVEQAGIHMVKWSKEGRLLSISITPPAGESDPHVRVDLAVIGLSP